MKWRGGRRSAHVQDRGGFGRRAGQVAGGGGLAALIVAGGAILFPDLRGLVLDAPAPGPNDQGGQVAAHDEAAFEFAQVTVAYTEDVWSEVFSAGAFPTTSAYRPATVVLYSERTETGCGFATSDFGPFYCPADETVYIDPRFYGELKENFDAPGDFAAAYVIAHEIAHHVQNVTGALSRAYSLRLTASDLEANRITVRIELQADCYAGLWARRAQDAAAILEEGDIAEALRAAHQVGDDVLMRMAGQEVNEDYFTHGSADQRMRWFLSGFQTGEVAACDTFSQAYEDL